MVEAFELLTRHGVNAIRLRLWNNPENVPESGGYCSLERTLALAKEIRQHGMSFMLDFHYSDWWADPGQQRKPKAWEQLDFAGLERAVYEYTRDTLLTMKREGVLPDMVQIGNEIRSGMLFPDGATPDYEHLACLVNAGIQGAREVAGSDEMQVMIHLDQGGRYDWLKEWFDKTIEAGLQDFDLIGLSYYPFWHGTFQDLKDSMEKLVADFHKPILVVETAYAWRMSKDGFIDDEQERIAGIPVSPEGQERVLELVTRIVDSLPEQMGRGIYYWEPLCIPHPGQGGWEENMGLLDESGQVMQGIRAFHFTREDSSRERLELLMEEARESAETMRKAAEAACGESGSMRNLLVNPDWETDLTGWQIEVDENDVKVELERNDVAGSALYVESKRNFTFCISQKVEIQEAGLYELQVRFRGTDTTNVNVRLFAETENQTYEQVIHPNEQGWIRYEIPDMVCERGILTVGIRIVSPPIYGRMRGFRLIKR